MLLGTTLLGTTMIATLAFAGVAQAADLPVKAPAPPAPVVYNWTGCYWGGHVGWGWSRKTVSEDFRAFPVVPEAVAPAPVLLHASGKIDTSGALYGSQVGCNYQFASNWVIGVEGSFSGADINGQNINPLDAFLIDGDRDNFNHVKIDWIASVTGRLGFVLYNSPLFFNNTLVYVKGGGAWAHDRWNVSDTLFGQPFGERTQTRSGWTIGGGLEWAWSFAPGWTSFTEYAHYDFGHKSLITADDIRVARTGDAIRFDVTQRVDVVKFGLNYRFNWSTPVAARY